jgi:hypothetical protein
MLALESFSDQELAAFNLALNWPGHVPEGNCSYRPALKANLIREDGHAVALEEIKRAIAVVFNQRKDAGTFE